VIAAQDRRRALTSQLEMRYQRVRSGPPQRDLDERLAAIVAADGAVVSFTIGVDGIGVAAVGPAGEASRFRPQPTQAELVDAVVLPLIAARERLTTPGGLARWQETLGRALGTLHETLGRDLRDLLAAVGGAHAVLVPHRLLHSLPLPAMHGDDGRTLADDVGPLSLLPALACHDPDAPRRLPRRPALAVGIPDARAPLMGLEAHAVARRMSVEPVLGPAAQPLEVAGQARDSRLVHLAVHGIYRAGLPGSSGIQLAPPADGLGIFGTANGLVSVEAVLGLFDLSGSSLVVLSACESALGEPSVTDDRTGLAGHLLLSGAARVIASLWSVDDVATLALMEAFYDRLTSSNPAAALRDASAWLRTASRCVVGERLAALRPLASEIGALDALNAGIARIGASDEPLGPDAWAAFVCYGAPRGRGDQWPDDV
jgi:CHAT domain-containing protein